jgi:hypothetical protein
MSITVTQEEAKFRPVTIVIDDVRTLNALRYAIETFYHDMRTQSIVGSIYTIDTTEDYDVARHDLWNIHKELEIICAT